jgi:hypothetical protein
MQAGRIVASGTHQELLATNPIYQQLYEIQFHLQREGTASPLAEAVR